MASWAHQAQLRVVKLKANVKIILLDVFPY